MSTQSENLRLIQVQIVVEYLCLNNYDSFNFDWIVKQCDFANLMENPLAFLIIPNAHCRWKGVALELPSMHTTRQGKRNACFPLKNASDFP